MGMISMKSSAGYVDTELKIGRKDPNWVYFVDIQTIQNIEHRWWGQDTIQTFYHINVDGRSLSSPETDNNHMKFDRLFDHFPSRPELDRVIDEYHGSVRDSGNEVDWAEKDRLAREAAQKALEEKRRAEFEEKLRREKEEAERKMKEEQEKDKVSLG